jgi:predicted dehydrogenase
MKILFLILILFISIQSQAQQIQLITLDPGHFHAALIQKTMYKEIDPLVHVYAPEGDDIRLHLERINSYNKRLENPTKWEQKVYLGENYFQKMLGEKAGNVVIISGNNKMKTEYILKSVEEGFNVLADKPMVIDNHNFEILKKAFSTAVEKDLLIYDIMTERFEITTILQKEFSMLPEVFGNLVEGSAKNPSVVKESIHHFYKEVSGSVLTRPAWFFDTAQEGEGLVDVMTHLVDLVQWECFPDQIINYETDIDIISAERWTTGIGPDQFKDVTKFEEFPDYLKKDTANEKLHVYCNGEINYKLKDIHVKTSVRWAYKAPEGSGDTHYSIMRGTKANLVIRQGAEENFKPVLYIEPVITDYDFEQVLLSDLEIINKKYPGIQLKKKEKIFEVIIPEEYKEGHEAHFARVTENFIEYLKNRTMPVWEIPNMLAKYYTTTKALQTAIQ